MQRTVCQAIDRKVGAPVGVAGRQPFVEFDAQPRRIARVQKTV
jgi:hypothetical protein